MRLAFITASLLISSITNAATPVNGWYSSLFGGYAYVPNNINTAGRTNAGYTNGYDAGGSIGFKSNPMRYEGQITYINAHLNKFNLNNIAQTGVSKYNNAVLAMATVYYDFNGISPTFQPFLGMGIGYAWVHAVLNSNGPNGATHYSGSNSVFAYQPTAGLTYNFTENYALNIGYRYVITHNAKELGKVFQANLGNLGVIYRFDVARYK
jgi:opacity protein-like surface antigen